VSKFIISLDFELHWGVFDTLENEYDDNLNGAREAIEKMLVLFKKYNIHVTWAVVGLLFNENINDYNKYKPALLPGYLDKSLRSLDQKVGVDEKSDKLHYAHSVIALIKSYPNQEIASHSYSHYYCRSKGQTIEEFEEDIRSAKSVAKDKFHIDLKSFVFPKNEINDEYLDILKKHGFTAYRGNPKSWIYKNGQQTNLIGRVIRVLDSYINVTGCADSGIEYNRKLINSKGGRFLRPYKNKFLNRLMLNRIKSEIKYSAVNNQNYHLWWHPHNFGTNVDENIDNLKSILIFYTQLTIKYNMKSVCMQNLK
jgi:peptidoglycan/xylan/chitin deacetylase (PgdA/CDA1 family)